MQPTGAEEKYLERVNRSQAVLPTACATSPVEGFSYFSSPAYVAHPAKAAPLDNHSRSVIKRMRVFLHHIVRIFREIGDSYRDLEPYLVELEQNGALSSPPVSLMASHPNQALWEELVSLASSRYGLRLGFTTVPDQLIFEGKRILFRYALVCIEEMDQERMSDAPSFDASDEVVGVYKTLGIAVNELAWWLRERDIRCQSNHPLGGLTNTPPLAAKAGLGWRGHHGILITPWWGPRQRIAPIYIEEPVFAFTDSAEHAWIEDFCQNCRRCERACPSGAILSKKVMTQEGIETIGQTATSIDRERCYAYFQATLGCGKCISVCPFGAGQGTYEKLKAVVEKRKTRDQGVYRKDAEEPRRQETDSYPV